MALALDNATALGDETSNSTFTRSYIVNSLTNAVLLVEFKIGDVSVTSVKCDGVSGTERLNILHNDGFRIIIYSFSASQIGSTGSKTIELKTGASTGCKWGAISLTGSSDIYGATDHSSASANGTSISQQIATQTDNSWVIVGLGTNTGSANDWAFTGSTTGRFALTGVSTSFLGGTLATTTAGNYTMAGSGTSGWVLVGGVEVKEGTQAPPDLNISVSDSITLTDAPDIEPNLLISVSDSITLTDSPNIEQAYCFSITSTITLTEFVEFIVSPQQLITTGKTTSTDTTTSASLVDIAGSSFTLTLKHDGNLIAFLSGQVSASNNNTTAGYAISINSVDSTVIRSFIGSATNNKETAVVVFRSGTLPAGTYTVVARHRTDEGTLTSTNVVLIGYSCCDDGGNTYNTDYVTIASDTVSSSSLTDIAGLTTSFPAVVGGHVWAAIAGSSTTNTNGVDYRFGVVISSDPINSVNEGINIADVSTVAVADRTASPPLTTPITVKGQHSVTAGTTTLAPAQMLVVDRRMTAFGQDWTIPSAHVSTANQSTTSATLVDIPGTTVQLTNRLTSYIIAHLTLSVQANHVNEIGSFAINIDGTDYEIIQHSFKVANTPDAVTVFARSATPLASGIHTYKARWACTQTSATTMSSVEDISISGFATETSFLNQNLESLDSITLSESVSMFIPILTLEVSDLITLSENIPDSNILSEVIASDLITLSEAVEIELVNFIDITDSITLSENIPDFDIPLPVDTVDSITLSEVTILETIEQGVDINDLITLSESVTIELDLVNVDTNDSITINESFDSEIIDQGVDVNDVITITESVNLLIIAAPGEIIDVTDTVTLSEVISVSQEEVVINISDDITITELVNLEIVAQGANVDTVTITESVNIIIQPVVDLLINVSDTITISESFSELVPRSIGNFTLNALTINRNYVLSA